MEFQRKYWAVALCLSNSLCPLHTYQSPYTQFCHLPMDYFMTTLATMCTQLDTTEPIKFIIRGTTHAQFHYAAVRGSHLTCPHQEADLPLEFTWLIHIDVTCLAINWALHQE